MEGQLRFPESGLTGAVFDKPDHDFPQRITYTLDGEQLHVSIGTIDGTKKVAWTWTRVSPARVVSPGR